MLQSKVDQYGSGREVYRWKYGKKSWIIHENSFLFVKIYGKLVK